MRSTGLSTNSVLIEYRPGVYAALEAEVLAAIQEDGADRVVLDLDKLDRLDSGGVREVISLLRRVRSIGGDLALRSTNPEVLRTLSATGLDRVFSLEGEAV
ncbi:MAG TPA: STAS domain-containing protein [Candidatus Cybelea sp.]